MSGLSSLRGTRGGRARIGIHYGLNAREASLMLRAMKSETDGLMARARELEPNDRYLLIHDWLAEHVTYVNIDSETDPALGEAYSPILYGRGNTDGIVRAFTFLAREAGLACVPTYGLSRGKRYPWVVVFLDTDTPYKGELVRHMDIAADVRITLPGHICRACMNVADSEIPEEVKTPFELVDALRPMCPDEPVMRIVRTNEAIRLQIANE